MNSNTPSFLSDGPPQHFPGFAGSASRTTFLDKGIDHLAKFIKTTYAEWETADRDGFFQQLDARVKVLFLVFFILIVSIRRGLAPEAIMAVFFFILIIASRLSIVSLYRRVLFFSFLFGFLIALPSALNIIARGDVVVPLVHLSKPRSFWVYHIPRTIGITSQGMKGVAMLTLRVMNSLTLSFLIIYTTPFSEIVKALKSFKVPDPFLMIMALSYKYIFIFAQTLEDVYLARKCRTVEASRREIRTWAVGRMVFLFDKVRMRCEDVFSAMQARGFCGEVSVSSLGRPAKRDILAGTFLFLAGLSLVFI